MIFKANDLLPYSQSSDYHFIEVKI